MHSFRYTPVLATKEGIKLPRYLLTSLGSLYEGFEADADWTLTNGGTKAANTSQVKQGTASEKVTTGANLNTLIRRTVAWDLSAAERFGIWIYVHDPIAQYTAADGCYIYFQTTSGLTSYYRFKFRNIFMDLGWNYFAVPLARALVTGTPDWSNIIRIAYQIFPEADVTPSLSFDDLWLNMRGVPAILLHFDDGYDTQYSVAFAHMVQHQIRGTLAARTDVIGTGGYLTEANLQEMHAAGWAIANHTNGATALAGQSEEDQTAQIQGGYDDLAAIGLSKNAKYLVYPSGTYDATTLAVMAALGVKTGRTTNPHTTKAMVLPASNPYRLESTSITTAVSLATAQGYVDAAITRKEILPLHFHGLSGTGSDWTQADFDTFIDYVAGLAAAGSIYPITIDDYYKLTLRAIRVPEVVA